MRFISSSNRFRSAASGSGLKVIGALLFGLTAFAAVSPAETLIIAHIPVGGGWSTRLSFANSGPADVTANVLFFSTTGQVGSVPVEGQGLQTSQNFIVLRNRVHTINLDPTQRNAGPLQVMWATVTTNGPLNILSLFDSSVPAAVPTTVPATAITGAVGSQSVAAHMTFRFPISAYGPLFYNAGLAISNPNNSTTSFTVFLFNGDGSLNNSVQMTLPADGQTSFVLTDPTIFGDNIDPSTLFTTTGSIAVCSTQPLGLVAIGIEGGALYTISVTNDPCPLT